MLGDLDRPLRMMWFLLDRMRRRSRALIRGRIRYRRYYCHRRPSQGTSRGGHLHCPATAAVDGAMRFHRPLASHSRHLRCPVLQSALGRVCACERIRFPVGRRRNRLTPNPSKAWSI